MSHAIRNTALLGTGGYAAYKLGQARSQYGFNPRQQYPQQSSGSDVFSPQFGSNGHRSKIVSGLELIAGFFLGRALFRRFNGAAHLTALKTAIQKRAQPHLESFKPKVSPNLN